MALDQLVWSFQDSLYAPMRLGYKVFYDYGHNELRFENNPQTLGNSGVLRGVFMRANRGISGIKDIVVSDDTKTKYTTGFHVFARKKGLEARTKNSVSKIVVPVIYSGITALGEQYNMPVVVAQGMYVPTPDEVEALSRGQVPQSARTAIQVELGGSYSVANLKRVKRFDYRPYVSPALAQRINEKVKVDG